MVDDSGISAAIIVIFFFLIIIIVFSGMNRVSICSEVYGPGFEPHGNAWLFNREIDCYNSSEGYYYYNYTNNTAVKTKYEPYVVIK